MRQRSIYVQCRNCSVNWYLIMITYLQHTDLTIPHYRDGEHTFVRGALCTIDRSFGILDHFFHHISGMLALAELHHSHIPNILALLLDTHIGKTDHYECAWIIGD